MNSSHASCRESEQDDPVTLRGTNRGLEIWISAGQPVGAVAEHIGRKLEQSPNFFAGGDVTLRFEEVPPLATLGPIEEVTQQYRLRIVAVEVAAALAGSPGDSSPDEGALDEIPAQPPALVALEESDGDDGSDADDVDAIDVDFDEPLAREDERAVLAQLGGRPPALAHGSGPVVTSEGPVPTRMITGPVRSGCVLEVAGHLIVVGDVNPGAEVVAAGSIVVLGRLRGIAHAGPGGFILAMTLEPQQLRLGSLVARAGDSDSAARAAEIAYARDGQIIVETYSGRLPFGIATAKL